MFERFNKDAIKVIMLAQEEARRLGHNFVGTEQILLGLIQDTDTIAGSILQANGINLRDAQIEVEKIIHRGSGRVAKEIPFTPRSKRLLELSYKVSKSLGAKYIGPEHLLLGLIDEGDGVAFRILQNFGIALPPLRQAVMDRIASKSSSEEHAPASARDAHDASTIFGVKQQRFSQCPNCLESIIPGAILCRFCQSGLSIEHYEPCAFCKEMIRKGAKLCRYCKSACGS